MIYRGIIHAHSDYSYDGKMSLVELRGFLVERGVSFACMSEHTDELTKEEADKFVGECRSLSDDSFVFVPGFEVPYKQSHILQFGSTQFLVQVADSEVLKSWSEEAAYTVLAHPVRNHFMLDETMSEVIDGVEIWNQQYEGKWLPRSRSAALLQKLRQNKPQLLASGGVDFHRQEHFGSPLTFIESDHLSETTILSALQSGHYSFGTDELMIDADANWQPTLKEASKSRFNILVIDSGKFTNKLLDKLGISLPKSLKQKIRQWI